MNRRTDYYGKEVASKFLPKSKGPDKITYSRPYEKNGKMVRDRLINGSVVSSEELGKAKSSDKKYKPLLLEDKDGNLIEVPIGDPIPKGAKLPTTRNVDLTPAQEIKRDLDLAKVESVISDSDPEDPTVQGYVDFYNSHNAKYKFVKQGEQKDIPFVPKWAENLIQSVKWVKVPKSSDVNTSPTNSSTTSPPPKVFEVRRGKEKGTGRTVIQYSDGSLKYAD